MNLLKHLAGLMSLCGAVALAQPAGSGYRLESQTVLPSGDTSWDYLALDASRHRLFIARRADGLGVLDTRTLKLLRTLDNSVGANGPLLVPEHGRGFVANTDGTLTVFDLATLDTLDRVRVDAGDLNAAFYEPSTQRVIAATGVRPRTSALISLDPRSGAVLARTDFDSTKIDTPAADGKGLLYVPLRDRGQILKVSATGLQVLETWPLGDCVNPVAVELDTHRQRLLVGFRGDKPVLVVLDVRSKGKVLATLPIGRGIDGLAHDVERGWIITSGGVDATLTVVRETPAGGYELAETIATRPMARTLAFDPATRRLWLVTAGFTQAPGQAAPRFHPDSFTVLSYAPR